MYYLSLENTKMKNQPVRTAQTSGRELLTSNQVHPCDNQTRRRAIENSLTNVQPTLETKQIKRKRRINI